MGFSLRGEGLLSAHLPNSAWVPLLSKFAYCGGFLIVILGRQHLYTETTITVILSLLSKRNLETTIGVLRLWGIVLFANLAGTYLFALCIGRIPVFSEHIQQALIEVSRSAAEVTFGIIFVRAIFAGWLLALMVWLLPAAESARVSIIIIITYLIGLTGSETWTAYILRFFIPTLRATLWAVFRWWRSWDMLRLLRAQIRIDSVRALGTLLS
jgi:formate-nitrite transporter family protein